jgi:hypothetical protein
MHIRNFGLILCCVVFLLAVSGCQQGLQVAICANDICEFNEETTCPEDCVDGNPTQDTGIDDFFSMFGDLFNGNDDTTLADGSVNYADSIDSTECASVGTGITCVTILTDVYTVACDMGDVVAADLCGSGEICDGSSAFCVLDPSLPPVDPLVDPPELPSSADPLCIGNVGSSTTCVEVATVYYSVICNDEILDSDTACLSSEVCDESNGHCVGDADADGIPDMVCASVAAETICVSASGLDHSITCDDSDVMSSYVTCATTEACSPITFDCLVDTDGDGVPDVDDSAPDDSSISSLIDGSTYTGHEGGSHSDGRSSYSSRSSYPGTGLPSTSPSESSSSADYFELGSPSTTADCTHDWECAEWGACRPDGLKARECTYMGDCGAEGAYPQLSEACTYVAPAPVGVPMPAAATCYDGLQNQGEQGVDCGGPCTRACAAPKKVIKKSPLNTKTLTILGIALAVLLLLGGLGFWKRKELSVFFKKMGDKMKAKPKGPLPPLGTKQAPKVGGLNYQAPRHDYTNLYNQKPAGRIAQPRSPVRQQTIRQGRPAQSPGRPVTFRKQP